MNKKIKETAQSKYDKKNTKQVMLKLNLKTDADIIEKLKASNNRQGYIKELIRNDLRSNGDILSIEAIKFLVIPIAKKYEIKRISVFGSYARNEAKKESDVDLIIDGGMHKGLIEYMKIVESFEESLGKKVDLITRLAIEEDKTEVGKRFRQNVEKEEIEIYAQ